MPQKCMGYAKELSWSFSRAKALSECPRSAWFLYWSQGEPKYAERVATLRQLTTLPTAAGAAVDYVIARALKAWRDDRVVLEGLPAVGVGMLRRQRAESDRAAGAIALGGKWRATKEAWLPPFQDHVYAYDLGSRYEADMEERVARCLANFESSEVWLRLRESDTTTWQPFSKLDKSPIPSISIGDGLTVWSSIDFAMGDSKGAVVLDWKSGNESAQAVEAAKDQLIVYAAWACRHFGLEPEEVSVQAVWLQREPKWCPEPSNPTELIGLTKRIEAETAAEKALVAPQTNARGRVLRYHAQFEKFPPRPSSRGCLQCRFRELCPEGTEACGHV